jgi:hypothetical protein
MEPVVEAVDNLARVPGVLRIGGREFAILPPTPRDMLATGERMRAFAKEKCLSPIDYVMRHAANMPAAALAIWISEAIKIGAGNGGETPPSNDLVLDQYATLQGVRWRVWYHISRVLKDFKIEEVAKLVTDDNLYDAREALDAALNFGVLDPNAPAPTTGTAS